MEAGSVFLVWLGCLEDGLVDVGVKLLHLLAWVEALEAVLLQCVEEDGVGHLNAVVQRNQVGVIRLELLGGHGAEGAVQVVDGLDEVAGEALDGEVLCRLGFALGAFLEVAEVGY